MPNNPLSYTDPSGYNGDRQGGHINTDLPAGRFPDVVEGLNRREIGSDPDAGHMCCPNGVRVRQSPLGPRMDIPAAGSRPHETIHFPAGTKLSW